MKNQLTWAADINDIQQLMNRYIINVHRMDYMSSYNELMANDNPDLEFEYMESGAYVGPVHVKQYMQALHDYMQSPQDKLGYMGLNHCMTPNVIINDSGDRAVGHWSVFSPWSQQATPFPCDKRKLTAMWFTGKYENEFIKVDGEWKILKIHLIAYTRSPYELGWVRQADAMRIKIMDGLTPDKAPRMYAYHPDAVYSSANIFNWGPFLPDDTDF